MGVVEVWRVLLFVMVVASGDVVGYDCIAMVFAGIVVESSVV